MLPEVDELALRQNTQRGADLLDEHITGWQWRINPLSLDVSDPQHCIGGQIGWEETKSILNHHHLLMSDVGMFRLNGNELWDDETYVLEYGILKDQWLQEIKRRRDGAGS
jgi:hypothetical protein